VQAQGKAEKESETMRGRREREKGDEIDAKKD